MGCPPYERRPDFRRGALGESRAVKGENPSEGRRTPHPPPSGPRSARRRPEVRRESSPPRPEVSPACAPRQASCRTAPPAAAARAGRVDLLQRDVAAEGEAAPAQGTESGSALDSTVRRPQPQALASSSSPPTRRCSKPASRSSRRRSAGAKAWTSTSPSSAWPWDCSASGTARRLAPTSAAPDRRRQQPGALRQRRQAVAVAGGLAGEGDHPARPQHALELGEGAVEVGDVVEDGVAEDEVEALVLEGQRLGLGGDRLALSRPSAAAVAASRFSIPGEMSVAVSRSITPSWTRLSEK